MYSNTKILIIIIIIYSNNNGNACVMISWQVTHECRPHLSLSEWAPPWRAFGAPAAPKYNIGLKEKEHNNYYKLN